MVEECYFFRNMSFREVIKTFRPYGLLLNLYNLSNHMNRHVERHWIEWWLEQRRLKNLQENVSSEAKNVQENV